MAASDCLLIAELSTLSWKSATVAIISKLMNSVINEVFYEESMMHDAYYN